MELRDKARPALLKVIVVISWLLLSGVCDANARPAGAAAQPPQAAVARAVGTIKTIDGTTIIVATDAGGETTVQLANGAKLVRIEPGAKDLKEAAPIALEDLKPGDRILVRGKLAIDGHTLEAASVIAMKHEDIAAKQAHEREEWQRHGVGGLVSAVDAATGTLKISTNSLGAAKEVTVQVSKQTVLRRYATNSVKFDDAKPAPIDQIHVGDQLRARGAKNADSTELTADEVVSGTFRNIAGTINNVDPAAGTITVMDLVTKKPVTVKVTAETQIRKLPEMVAQRIAVRMRGAAEETPAAANGTATPAAKPAEGATGVQSGGRRAGQFGAAGGGARAGGTGGGDLQQALSRMPAATLADLQKGDAVMIVATEGSAENDATAITLLAGVEPILEASPKGGASSILTPWTMSEAPAGDTNQ
ncbi:MAG TPA: DUF5666 domain-containing protein [Candidatus Solibacter sp.]|nr:DUF5666 domain-containing protein [Candidatus Solibacter sp.]